MLRAIIMMGVILGWFTNGLSRNNERLGVSNGFPILYLNTAA